MFRSRGSKALLVGALALLAASSPSAARADTVVLQESRGFFGSNSDETARQKVSIGEQKLKVVDSARGWALYVRLDKKSVTEAFAAEKGFVEKPLASFAEIRTQREKTRAEKVEEYKKQVDRAKDDSEKRMLKQALEKMGLREDGKTIPRFETFPEDTKKVSLVVDNERREVEVTHHKIRENEGSPIFDVWVAPKLKAPANMFAFYEELGTFSKEIIAEVKKLDGFPVEITAVLDDGNNQKTLHSSIKEIRHEEVAAAEYDVPASFKPVERAPEKDPKETARKVVCAICGKECTPGTGEASWFTEPFGAGRRFAVCSEAHRTEIIQRVAKEARGGQK